MPEDSPASGPSEELVDGDSFFRGLVSRITYRNNESGFGVMKAEPESGSHGHSAGGSSTTTVVGILPLSLSAGISIIARGQWQTHPRFGRQFRAWSITEADPTGVEAIVRYLSSDAIKGFGPTLAQRVVELFGERTLEILDETPDRLLEVQGIGQKKLAEIIKSWSQKRNLREVLLFFQNHGVSLSLAQRIYNAYGDRSIEKVSENPYRLAREVWGIGFITADRIAAGLGIEPNSPQRLAAGVVYSLDQAADDGHCYLPLDKLLERSSRLLKVTDREALEQAVLDSALRADIVKDQENLYTPALYMAEQQLARNIAARIGSTSRPNKALPDHLVASACEQAVLAEPQGDFTQVIRLSPEQQRAIRLAADNGLVVITGGPGCGKTTLLRTLAKLFRQSGLETRLAAPTGRAAQRMAEVCNMPASTIHRMLKFDPNTRGFVHNQDEQLDLDALIIDEASMIDLPLAAALLQAVPAGARLVIVGDADQLPSVGPGLFLADLLDIQPIPRIRLTTLFRRADESLITTIAHQVNGGVIPDIPEPDGTTKTDAYFLSATEAEDAAALIERLVTEQLPKKFGFNPSDITVLTPMNQGPLGVVALNQRLQQKLVPNIPGMAHVKIGDLELRLGDRICQRVNNYNLHANGVFNGDQGRVRGVDLDEKAVFVELWDGREIRYPAETLSQLDLAYALTIHRSQGSEVPAIVLALHEAHTIMLERQLIYTAITRARKLLVIVGTRKALATAVKRTRSKRRYSQLTARTTRFLEL